MCRWISIPETVPAVKGVRVPRLSINAHHIIPADLREKCDDPAHTFGFTQKMQALFATSLFHPLFCMRFGDDAVPATLFGCGI